MKSLDRPILGGHTLATQEATMPRAGESPACRDSKADGARHDGVWLEYDASDADDGMNAPGRRFCSVVNHVAIGAAGADRQRITAGCRGPRHTNTPKSHGDRTSPGSAGLASKTRPGLRLQTESDCAWICRVQHLPSAHWIAGPTLWQSDPASARRQSQRGIPDRSGGLSGCVRSGPSRSPLPDHRNPRSWA